MDMYVDVNGHKLFCRITGSGKPVVIFENGLGDSCEIWHLVEPKVAEFAQTVVYDRAGVGRSNRATTPRTLTTIVNDLEILLTQLRLESPCLLVGHSLGGLIVRLYAANHPESVAGIVLVDAPHEQQTEAARKMLSQQAWNLISGFWLHNPEGIDLAAEMERVGAISTDPDMALTVLSATVVQSPPFELQKEIAAEIAHISTKLFPSFQVQLAETSSRSQLVRVEDAGHYIHLQRPDVIVTAIRTMCKALSSTKK